MKKDTLYTLIGLLIVIIFIIQQNNDLNINIISDDNDDVYDESIKEPKRYYDSKYHTRRAMRVNVPTRGEAPPYQQVGILTDTDDPENIKPLYGRQTYRGSGQWNYFTSLDSHLATKIPVYMDNQDCTDERGCKELDKGSSVSMGQDGNTYNASIYGNISPRYLH